LDVLADVMAMYERGEWRMNEVNELPIGMHNQYLEGNEVPLPLVRSQMGGVPAPDFVLARALLARTRSKTVEQSTSNQLSALRMDQTKYETSPLRDYMVNDKATRT
jgi:hypothetical protein